jgi:predicted membrane protein
MNTTIFLEYIEIMVMLWGWFFKILCCMIVRWWFSSVILMFFSFLFIMMVALTFSQCSHHEYLIFGFGILFWILFVFSIIFTVLAIILFFSSITFAVIAIMAITIEHPSKSKYLNWEILWDKIEIFNPNLADDKFVRFKEVIRKCPKWLEDHETESSEF